MPSTLKPAHLALILLSAAVLVCPGCLDAAAKKTILIEQMIQGGLAVKDDIMKDSAGTIGGYDVYRDGEKDGVVFEYQYAENVIVDQSQLTEESVRQQMLETMSADADSKKIIGMGIYVRFIFKSAQGETYVDTTITQDDL